MEKLYCINLKEAFSKSSLTQTSRFKFGKTHNFFFFLLVEPLRENPHLPLTFLSVD